MFVSSVQRLVTSAALFVDARRRLGREDRAGANTISPAFSSFFVVSFVRSVARWLDVRESRCEEEESRRVVFCVCVGMEKCSFYSLTTRATFAKVDESFEWCLAYSENRMFFFVSAGDALRGADEESHRGGGERHPFRLCDDVQPVKRTVRLDTRDEGYQNAGNRK